MVLKTFSEMFISFWSSFTWTVLFRQAPKSARLVGLTLAVEYGRYLWFVHSYFALPCLVLSCLVLFLLCLVVPCLEVWSYLVWSFLSWKWPWIGLEVSTLQLWNDWCFCLLLLCIKNEGGNGGADLDGEVTECFTNTVSGDTPPCKWKIGKGQWAKTKTKT